MGLPASVIVPSTCAETVCDHIGTETRVDSSTASAAKIRCLFILISLPGAKKSKLAELLAEPRRGSDQGCRLRQMLANAARSFHILRKRGLRDYSKTRSGRTGRPTPAPA